MSYVTPPETYGTLVLGGNTKFTPDWWHGESVHSVWAISPRNDPLAASVVTSAGVAGYGAPSAVGVEVLRTYAWYAFTSAKPIVLLIPSVKSAGRVWRFTGIAPSPPCPLAGAQTNHVPKFAA